MGVLRKRYWLGALLAACLMAGLDTAVSRAADWGWVHEGMAEDGKFVAGFRTGPSFMTQSAGTATTGPTLNFHGMYPLNKWFRAGMMLEWENHSVDGTGTGSLNTVSLLPALLEYRPGHFGPVIPYVSTGIGVNINDNNVSDSFAWRIAGGIDFALTNWVPTAPQGLMLNTEVAWKRNKVDRGEVSTLNWLFGVRYAF